MKKSTILLVGVALLRRSVATDGFARGGGGGGRGGRRRGRLRGGGGGGATPGGVQHQSA